MQTSKEYGVLLRKYQTKDALKAIVLYVIYLLLLLMQGLLFTTNIDSNILSYSQIFISMLQLSVCILFIILSKENMKTIGLLKEKILESILLGIFGAAILVTVIFLYNIIILQRLVSFQVPSALVICTFTLCAIPEEIIFRGYMQTRLTGLIKNNVLCTLITGILFVFIHYPVRWVATSTISFTLLPWFFVICLILLHLICNFVYRKTNCLWGAIVLHITYNIATSMMFFKS